VDRAIDDLGTGFSSLKNLLRRRPAQDRPFRSSDRLGGEPADAAMVAAICDLGRALGLDVIAEDVEHAAQRTALLALDCVLAKGYWTSRPSTPTVSTRP
jgi:EAL domain-containing protein (putative c-di-GMP-specific phosphodiesterase class I)